MNKNLFYIWFILSNIVFAGLQDTTFNKYDEVNNVFESYLLVVDEKNITKMSKYFQTDWCTLHFGSGIPIVITNKEEFNIVFNNWKNSLWNLRRSISLIIPFNFYQISLAISRD